MLALALLAAVAAFALTQKPKGKAPRSPFTDASCTELVEQKKLERWSAAKLRREWNKMLGEGYDALPDEDTTVNLLIATEDLLRRTLSAGCFDANTDAYTDLFRMTWCSIQLDLVEQGRLTGLDVDELLPMCADYDFDPRDEVYTGGDHDADDDEWEAGDDTGEFETGDAIAIDPSNPFVIGTPEPCTQIVPGNVLVEWADDYARPALNQAVTEIPDFAAGLAPDEYLDHDDVLLLTDAVLVLTLTDECIDAETPAYVELYRWLYCAVTAELVRWDWVEGVTVHEVISECEGAPAGLDPRDTTPWWHEDTQTAQLQTNPSVDRGVTGRTGGHLRIGRTGQGLRCANPGGMLAPNVSVSDAILTGQMTDAHCPGSKQHPCLDDDNRIVYPTRSNPGRGPRGNPCGVGACG